MVRNVLVFREGFARDGDDLGLLFFGNFFLNFFLNFIQKIFNDGCGCGDTIGTIRSSEASFTHAVYECVFCIVYVFYTLHWLVGHMFDLSCV